MAFPITALVSSAAPPPQISATGSLVNGPPTAPNVESRANPAITAQLPRLSAGQVLGLLSTLTASQRKTLLGEIGQLDFLPISLKSALAGLVRSPTEAGLNLIKARIGTLSSGDVKTIHASLLGIANSHLPPGGGYNPSNPDGWAYEDGSILQRFWDFLVTPDRLLLIAFAAAILNFLFNLSQSGPPS